MITESNKVSNRQIETDGYFDFSRNDFRKAFSIAMLGKTDFL